MIFVPCTVNPCAITVHAQEKKGGGGGNMKRGRSFQLKPKGLKCSCNVIGQTKLFYFAASFNKK